MYSSILSTSTKKNLLLLFMYPKKNHVECMGLEARVDSVWHKSVKRKPIKRANQIVLSLAPAAATTATMEK